ncbi:antibiotic biosynthesis monooxygenase family protein [Aminobacter carboxidus]|uniref:Antibiotic biosynthesis monooxygenase n=1 Tax=Aminobacter carboxidus TaxID=376165 RepID=A0ABR9GPY7_9HYPH|nr:antibiotic biosynthesis monooxygenase [Aminobacter carboxidus]MBE1205654.1 antibiotic biosynthesis monooxygenase [Aminobacter carboxidus]
MSQNVENELNGPVAFVNIFTLKPGKLDEFIALQKVNLGRSVGNVPGWRGSRLHRSIDGNTAIMISTFDSVADHKRVHQTQGFAEHIAKVGPLIESAVPGYYQVVHEVTQA